MLCVEYVLCSVTQSCLTLYSPMDCSPPGSSKDFSGKNTGVGCHFVFQGICPVWDQTAVSSLSCIGRRYYTTNPTREAQYMCRIYFWEYPLSENKITEKDGEVRNILLGTNRLLYLKVNIYPRLILCQTIF